MSNWRIGNESCRSIDGTRSPTRTYHLHQFGPYKFSPESSLRDDEFFFLRKQIAAPEGLNTFYSRFPHVKVVTGWIDEGLNDKAYIIPGLGDFGERR